MGTIVYRTCPSTQSGFLKFTSTWPFKFWNLELEIINIYIQGVCKTYTVESGFERPSQGWDNNSSFIVSTQTIGTSLASTQLQEENEESEGENDASGKSYKGPMKLWNRKTTFKQSYVFLMLF